MDGWGGGADVTASAAEEAAAHMAVALVRELTCRCELLVRQPLGADERVVHLPALPSQGELGARQRPRRSSWMIKPAPVLVVAGASKQPHRSSSKMLRKLP